MSATIQTVLSEINRVKQCGRAQLYIYIRNLAIKPLGQPKQRPQLYPADTAQRILTHLGINGADAPLVPDGPTVAEPHWHAQLKTKAVRRDTRTALVTLHQLRKQRASAKRKATR